MKADRKFQPSNKDSPENFDTMINENNSTKSVDDECRDVKDLYYWEVKPSDGDIPTDPAPLLKVGHLMHWAGSRTFDGCEFVGEVIATFLGLTKSKYQWVLDAKRREEEWKVQHELEERQRKQLRLMQLLEEEKQKLAQLESGTSV